MSRWTKHAIKQTEKAIKTLQENKWQLPTTNRRDCTVCKFVKGVYKITPCSPFDEGHYSCSNLTKYCPARKMCREYVNIIIDMTYRKSMVKALQRHLVKLQEIAKG